MAGLKENTLNNGCSFVLAIDLGFHLTNSTFYSCLLTDQ